MNGRSIGAYLGLVPTESSSGPRQRLGGISRCGNGHQRWPEAKGVLDEFWAELPDSYRYHVLLQRQEQEYLDWDLETESRARVLRLRTSVPRRR